MNKQRKVLITTIYNEMGIVIDTKAEEVAQPEILACGEGELNVPDTNVGDTISRQAAIDAFEDTTFTKNEILRRLSELPSAQHEPISEEYAKAVRTWLINYQVRCAELMGRYTPYEILGWIVSDWRKENEIW